MYRRSAWSCRVRRVFTSLEPYITQSPEATAVRGLFSVRKAFVDGLGELKRTAQFSVYSYCLMPNHSHILIEPERFPALGDYDIGM